MREVIDRIVKDRKFSIGLLGILLIILVFLCFQGYTFYRLSTENDKLLNLKEDYELLLEEIADYRLLKSQYEVVLTEGSDLQNNKGALEEKIVNLQNEIRDLEKKIADVNNKIKKLS